MFAVLALLALCLPGEISAQIECPKKSGAIRYSLESARPGQNGVYLFKFQPGTGKDTRWIFDEDAYMDIHAGGHAVIRGTIRPTDESAQYSNGFDKLRFHMVLRYNPEGHPVLGDVATENDALDWNFFRVVDEKSKIIGHKDGEKFEFPIYAMERQDGIEGKYDVQVGDGAALIGDGESLDAYGASTWFMYKNENGTLLQADVNVILEILCKNLKPVCIESVCSDKDGKNKWLLTNYNHKSVRFEYDGEEGKETIWVSGRFSKRKGRRYFYTPSSLGEEINLKHAAYNNDFDEVEDLSAEAKVEGCDRIKPDCSDKQVTFKVKSYAPNGHSIWLSRFNDGKNANLHFEDNAYFTYFKDLSEGYMEGDIETELLGEDGWKFYGYFGEAPGDVAPKYEKGGSNGDGYTQKELEAYWEYLILTRAYIVNEGGDKVIEIKPMNMPYGMQIGYSASGKDFDFGASTWFEWHYDGRKAQGDINVDLMAKCEEKEEVAEGCPKHSGAIRYGMTSARPGENGVYLFKFEPGTGKDTRWIFDDDAHMQINTGGHAVFTGTIRPTAESAAVSNGFDKLKFKMVLKYNANGVPVLGDVATAEDAKDWNFFTVVDEKSKMIGYKDGQKYEFPIYAMERQDGIEGKYDVQVGNGAALIGDGESLSAFGASTWFMYKNAKGTLLQADINVILDIICKNIKPVHLEGACSDRADKNKWLLVNYNKRPVRFEYMTADGVKVVSVPGRNSRRNGRRFFYTPASLGNKLTLKFAAYDTEFDGLAPLMANAKVDGCDRIKPDCTDDQVTYHVRSYKENGHSIWLSKFDNGKNVNLHFGDDAYFTFFKDMSEGYMEGEVETEFMGEEGWKFYAYFEAAGDDVAPKYEKGGTNSEGKNQAQLEEDWKYLLLKYAYIVNEEGDKIVEIKPMDMPYGMQIGYSASGKDFDFGASTWFAWHYEGRSAQGDINVDLIAKCVEDEEKDCKEITMTGCAPFKGGFKITFDADVDCDEYSYQIVNTTNGKIVGQGRQEFKDGEGKAWFRRTRRGSPLMLVIFRSEKGNYYCPLRFMFNGD
ncbi:MAG: hypothetical protein AAFU64_00220 [Bacteroidota bacterium]